MNLLTFFSQLNDQNLYKSNLIRVEGSSHFGENNTGKSSSETANYIGMVIGALTVIILILLAAILLIVVRNQRAKQDCTNKVRYVFLKHNNTRISLAYRPAG